MAENPAANRPFASAGRRQKTDFFRFLKTINYAVFQERTKSYLRKNEIEQKMNLRAKIITGYLILVAVIGSMAAILIHERQRIRDIEVETFEIREIRQSINAIHHHITTLSISGENVIDWEEVDYRNYQIERLQTDSLLQAMKPYCINYVQPQQIDTLRILLAEKERICVISCRFLNGRKKPTAFW